MKLAFISIGSWIVGLMTLALGTSLIRVFGASHAGGSSFFSLVTIAFLFALAYGPTLSWLRNRVGSSARASIFPLTSSLVLNLPVFLISLLAIGRTLAAPEAYAVMISFAAMGATFGFGFVLSSHRQKRIKEPSPGPRMIVRQQALVSRLS
jgi:hypothetical protein